MADTTRTELKQVQCKVSLYITGAAYGKPPVNQCRKYDSTACSINDTIGCLTKIYFSLLLYI